MEEYPIPIFKDMYMKEWFLELSKLTNKKIVLQAMAIEIKAIEKLIEKVTQD